MRRVVAIVGATATGKTALAIELARRLDGEIIGADSRQVYRGMDLGTAKPTPAEQARAQHWLIDVVDPDQPFTLASFLDAAQTSLDDVWSRGKQPILCGGTGQYVWALLEGWTVPRVGPDPALRADLEARAEREGVAAVFEELRQIDPESADDIGPTNLRRMIRAIEVTRSTGRPFSAGRERVPPPFDATILGLSMPRERLYARIDARVDVMIEAGLPDEVRSLNARGYGCDLAPMSGIGYRQICEHLAGACTLEAAAARMKTETHRLARMQHTWFRDDDARIRWLDAQARDLVEQALAALEG